MPVYNISVKVHRGITKALEESFRSFFDSVLWYLVCKRGIECWSSEQAENPLNDYDVLLAPPIFSIGYESGVNHLSSNLNFI